MHHFVSKTQMQFKHYKDKRWYDLRKIQFQITTGSNSTHLYHIYSNRKWSSLEITDVVENTHAERAEILCAIITKALLSW